MGELLRHFGHNHARPKKREKMIEKKNVGNAPLFRFSPSGMNLARDCPRCFWLEHVAHIPRVRGIFPGLPGAVDNLIQSETAKYKGKGKPSWLLPWLKEGVIKTGPKRLILKRDTFILTGRYDDLIVLNNGSVIIIDYKTARAPHSEKDTIRYYQAQLNMYTLLCEANGMHVEDTGYIVYTTPDYLEKFAYTDSFGMNFKVTHVALSVSARRARDAIAEAVKICMQKEAPQAAYDCEYCQYRNREF